MKLYTEEQLLNTVTAIQDYNDKYDEKVAQEMIKKHLKVLEPIEIVDHQERIMMDKNGISYKLKSLSDKLDNALEKETTESLNQWLQEKRFVQTQEVDFTNPNAFYITSQSTQGSNSTIDTNKIVEEDYNPYCKECEACGEEGCCSALQCNQSPNGDYCATYLMDLRFGYAMNRWVETQFVHKLTDEQRALYNEQWDKQYDLIYTKPNEDVDTNNN